MRGGPGCPAGCPLWPLLFAVVLAVLAPRLCCVALTPESPPSSSTTIEEGLNAVDGDERAGEDALGPGAVERRYSDRFFHCYKDSKDSALSCLGESAQAGLSSFFSSESLLVSDGLSLVKETSSGDDPNEGREAVLFDDANAAFSDGQEQEKQHKTVIDSAASYLSARSLRWDMSSLYPGLTMRVGPTLTGSGMLEFVLEPRRYYTDRQLGPSRMLLKQVVLPFLLGVKVSVASLVPLLLFTVVFLAKKALLMSHLSALLSSFLGFGAYGHGHPHGHSFGSGLDLPAGAGLGGPLGNPLGGSLGGSLGSPLGPIRSSAQQVVAQTFPGPQILHVGQHTDAVPPWLTPVHQHQPHHLFRGVNYDFRDERHSSGVDSGVDSGRNTRGFRWEERDKEPAGLGSGSGSGSGSGMHAAGVVIRRGW